MYSVDKFYLGVSLLIVQTIGQKMTQSQSRVVPRMLQHLLKSVCRMLVLSRPNLDHSSSDSQKATQSQLEVLQESWREFVQRLSHGQLKVNRRQSMPKVRVDTEPLALEPAKAGLNTV